MKWRRIKENEVTLTIQEPDSLEGTLKGRINATKMIDGRLLKITYKPDDEIMTVVTAMVKGK